ncbi:MAG: translation initiation factor IF-2 subunit gamma [Candidatus Micrarchaeia archaeon]
MSQATVNIGIVGHVDHGKTTLTRALTGKWTDTHSEEVKRGITIKLGYADIDFYECKACGGFHTGKCPCGSTDSKFLRRASFLDAPGHETLMATVIAASSIMDGAIFVIAANEECPQPQTIEHLMVIEAAEIKNVVIVQNKVDLVTKEKALEHYKQMREFLKGSSLENAPVIPVVANTGANVGALVQALYERIPEHPREEGNPVMYLARSFDVNKPGTEVEKLLGGVVGGSMKQGVLRVGDAVEISPGVRREKKGKEHYEKLSTKVMGLHAGNDSLEEARPGGLVAVATELDPALAKGDSLVGCVLAKKAPDALSEIKLDIRPLPRVLEKFPETYLESEPLVIGAGTATTVGFVVEQKKKKGVRVTLKKPICVGPEDKIAIMRRANNRWRLYATARLME